MAELTTHETEILQTDTDINIQIEQILSQVKLLKVIIPDLEDVKNYLLHYPDIIDSILPICKLVKKEFPSPTQISLEIYHDPEIDDEYITIETRQQNYDESVMKRIKEIGINSEMELIGKKGWIFVTTDFRQPR